MHPSIHPLINLREHKELGSEGRICHIKMKTLLILLGLVSVTLARIAVNNQEKLAPKPCCFPKTMQINYVGAKFHESIPLLFRQIGTYGIKYDEKLVAVQILDGKTRQPLFKEVADFNTNVIYNISADGSCVKSPNPDLMPPPCIPDGATYDSTYTMGIGDNSIQANLWNHQYPKLNIQDVISLTKECIPVQFQSNAKTANGKTYKAISYVHAEIEIVDKDLFTIPDTCKSSNEEASFNVEDMPVPVFMLKGF